MSTFLPVFPLRLVAYPGEALNLHIFEPRYKQLINEVEHRGITFGIPAYLDDKVQAVGTEIELVEIDRRYDNGEMDVRTRGKGLFRIKEFLRELDDRLYSGAEVNRLEHDLAGDFLKYETILGLLTELYGVLNLNKPIPPLDDKLSTYTIGHHVGFSLEQEYEMLTILEETLRQDFIIQHLEKLIPTAREMEELRKKVQMNGHFKNILPPKL